MQMFTEQTVTETNKLVSLWMSVRGYTFTFPCLFFSPQEDVVKSYCAGAVPFRWDGLLLQDLYLSTVIYLLTGSLDSYTKSSVCVQLHPI